MRGRLGGLLLMSVIGTFHGAACAQGTEGLQVERAPGAETCPDAVSLSQRIAAIRGRPLTFSRLSYEVYFTRTGETFSATIVSGLSGESRRVLEGRGTCAALAQATAVTLALLFDSDAESAAKPEVEPAPALAPEPESSHVLPATLRRRCPARGRTGHWRSVWRGWRSSCALWRRHLAASLGCACAAFAQLSVCCGHRLNR